MKEEELAAAAEVRQERDVLAQMVRTLQERERERQTAPAPGAQLKAQFQNLFQRKPPPPGSPRK
jgi:hypothetical protein